MALEPNRQADPDLIVAQLLDLEKHVAWDGGYELTALTFKKRADYWLLIVKAVRKGKPYVAYARGSTYPEAAQIGGLWADTGSFLWFHDRWPTAYAKERMAKS